MFDYEKDDCEQNIIIGNSLLVNLQFQVGMDFQWVQSVQWGQ